VQTALELGVPVSAIAEAVFARSASGDLEVREACRGVLGGPKRHIDTDRRQLVDDVRQALWSSKVVAYAQGLEEIRRASEEYGWDVDIATVARIWRGGCIIRARLLKQISDEYAAHHLPTLLVAPSIKQGLAERQDAWRRVVARATAAGVPVPGFSSALAYYDTVRAERLPAALVQGLRDNFGAHTYRRTDVPGSFHTLWAQDRSEVQTS
jgi:6-phosphogluconate dehydrogenase